jgi:hypothetical protein
MQRSWTRGDHGAVSKISKCTAPMFTMSQGQNNIEEQRKSLDEDIAMVEHRGDEA